MIKYRPNIKIRQLLREANELMPQPESPVSAGYRYQGVSPPVYPEPTGYLRETNEARHDREWPNHQPHGDNRQSLVRFGRGRGKQELEAALDRQLVEDEPGLSASSIKSFDRLLGQVLDDYNRKSIGAKTTPAILFDQVNSNYPRTPNRSILEEDVLYESMEEFIEAQKERAQFFVLGDTNHRNALIQKKLYDPALLAQFKEAGVKCVFLEGFRFLQDNVDALRAGRMSQADFIRDGVARTLRHMEEIKMGIPPVSYKRNLAANLKGMAEFIRAAAKQGMEVHCMDSFEGGRFQKGKLVVDYRERLAIDGNIAARIKDIAGNRKALVIYGAAHGAYKGTLDELLGFERVVRINVHTNIKQFWCSDFNNKTHIDYQPLYLCLAEEDKIILAPNNYARKCDIDEDPFQCARDPEVDALRERRKRQAEQYKAQHMPDKIFMHEMPHRTEFVKNTQFFKTKNSPEKLQAFIEQQKSLNLQSPSAP